MLEDLEPKSKSSNCKVREVKNSLEPSDQEILDRYLKDTVTWSSLALSEALSKKGLRISIHPIIRHRKGLCSC